MRLHRMMWIDMRIAASNVHGALPGAAAFLPASNLLQNHPPV